MPSISNSSENSAACKFQYFGFPSIFVKRPAARDGDTARAAGDPNIRRPGSRRGGRPPPGPKKCNAGEFFEYDFPGFCLFCPILQYTDRKTVLYTGDTAENREAFSAETV